MIWHTSYGITMDYYCVKDSQGNIVLLVDKNRYIACRYEYDALGNCTILYEYGQNNIGTLNPFRWKGFYYDTESGFYYANGSYYDPETMLYVDAQYISTVVDKAYDVRGLDRNGIVCNNILELAGNPFTIDTATELASDPNYDGSIPTNWLQSVARWFSNLAVVKWYRGLSNGGKAAVGCVLFALSLVLAFVTGGMSAAIQVTVEVAIGVGVGIGIWALSALATGQQLTLDGLATAALDSFVVSSLFAFIQQSITAIKYIARSKPYPEADLAVECAGYCFIAGTLVHCEDGLKNIEDIEVGDKVLAYNEETGEQAYKTVLHLFRNESKDWTGITVNDKEIVSTPGHKYYLPNTKQWVSAQDLKIGDTVLLSNGQSSKVQATRSIHYDIPQTTYNFEVEDFHTYYVETGVLVHNKNCAFDDNQRAVIELAKEYRSGVTREQGKTLVQWAKEYGINSHGPMIHPARSGIWGYTEHIKIFKYHIKIIS